ncbi:MAG: rRNA maturation RNase YbeY [Desulfobacterales bacterium]
MGVLIDNRQKKFKVPIKTLRSKTQAVLNALGCPDKELSMVITDDDGIQQLNKAYLFRDRPTNVIAFPMQEGDFPHVSPDMLGDVVISAETAAREAQNAGMGFMERFDELVVHGILHLLGYDHEKNEKEAAEMRKKSIEMLKAVSRL